MKQVLIDKIFIRPDSKEEFLFRLKASRDFVKRQPGFVRDGFYVQTEESGDLVVFTIVIWTSVEALAKGREAVQAEYKRTGFNLKEFCQKHNIKIEPGTYQVMED